MEFFFSEELPLLVTTLSQVHRTLWVSAESTQPKRQLTQGDLDHSANIIYT